MSKIWNSVRRFGKDEQGGPLIEYTVLLAVLVVAVIGTIVLVGGWINGVWSNLWANLQGQP